MSFKLIKFYNTETGQWETVAACNDKGEKGEKGDPFTYEDFTLEQLEELKGYHFTPSVDEEGNLSWTNDGGLENPETINVSGKDLKVIHSSTPPEETTAILWVVDDEEDGVIGNDVITSNSVNRIEVVDEYPETLEKNILYIKVK